MLIQALAEYADTRLGTQLEEEYWEEKGIPFFLEIDILGRFITATPHEMQVARGKKTISIAAPLAIPKSPVPRNSGVYPLIAVDDIKYVLGPGPWTAKDQEENNRERFGGFVDLLRHAARATNDEALQACCRFYDQPDQVERARQVFATAKPGTNVALSVSGPLVNRQAVKEFWRDHFRSASQARVARAGLAECLISGQAGSVSPTHEKIKGLANLGGQSTGVSLMSFDKEAFRSYGWEQCANSPVSSNRATAYVLALNDLLKPGSSGRRDIAGIAFIFWTRERTSIDLTPDLFDPDPAQIHKLLKRDQVAAEFTDPNMYYMAGLGANGGRLLIRYWVAETLGNTRRNVLHWHLGLRIINPATNKSAEPPRLWQLLSTIDREGEPPVDRVLSLIRRAIQGPGQPLGSRMLAAVLTRLRAERREKPLEPVRHGLLRLCTNDSKKKGEVSMPEELDDGIRERAYLCGRLLAVLEGLQEAVYRANKESKVNLTVADRYYNLASVSPQVAFPKIVSLGKKHLAKLGRERGGLKFIIERDLAELCDLIKHPEHGDFPGNLSLVDQGRFALGYYHQRAASLNRKKNNTADNESAIPEEEQESEQ